MPGQRYYDLWDDMLIPGRWVLGDVRDARGELDWINPGQFTSGRPANISAPLVVEVLSPGKTLDFSITHCKVPVVNKRAADLLGLVCGNQVQLIPVSVRGCSEPYFIANATRTADCVDEQRSEGVRVWTAGEGRPDRVGDYHPFDRLRIDPGRTNGLDIFYPARYTGALIVSERLKRAMEEARLEGPQFDPVT